MNLTEKYPILQHMGKEKKQMCQGSCLMGFLLDHKSLKIGAFDVERSFTCCRLVELCEEVMNFKNEIDKKEEARMFGEEFHTLGHIFLCTEHAPGLQMQNGHIELSVAFTKLASIVPILVCKNPFYKTLSMRQLLSWHIIVFNSTTMLFGCFMGLLMVFIDFNFF
jgi:3,4-dihydroxy 2-butanone 4-phosphate synthase